MDVRVEVLIKHWSHSSLMAFLRNPLAWRKRYVEKVYDTPSSPASIIGRAGHVALQHFYGGIAREGAITLGLEHLESVTDAEVNFGRATTKKDKKKKREQMRAEYLQAIHFYLEKPPRYRVKAVEFSATATVDGLLLPLKSVSDLVVESRGNPGSLDIIDHKFVDSFSRSRDEKALFVVQALFNYHVVRHAFDAPVRRFILHECKKRKNIDGKSQMRRYVIDFERIPHEFQLFERLINDATRHLASMQVFLPNPSDIFEGEHSFDIYRMGL
jgi:RecB family exonuclease